MGNNDFNIGIILTIIGIIIAIIPITYGVCYYIFKERIKKYRFSLAQTYKDLSNNFIDTVAVTLGIEDIYENKLVSKVLFQRGVPLAKLAHALDRLHTLLKKEKIKHSDDQPLVLNKRAYALARIFVYEAASDAERFSDNEETTLRWLRYHFLLSNVDIPQINSHLRENSLLYGLYYTNKIYSTLEVQERRNPESDLDISSIESDMGAALDSYRLSEEYNEKYNLDHEWKKRTTQTARICLYEKLFTYFGLPEHMKAYINEYNELNKENVVITDSSNEKEIYIYLNIGERYLIEKKYGAVYDVVNNVQSWCGKNREKIEKRLDLQYLEKAGHGLRMACILFEKHNLLLNGQYDNFDLNWIVNISDEINKLELLHDVNSYYCDLLTLLIDILRAQNMYSTAFGTEARSTIRTTHEFVEDKRQSWFLGTASTPAMLLKTVCEDLLKIEIKINNLDESARRQ
jgi:hypothetical protein